MADGPATTKVFNPTDGTLANDPSMWLESVFVYFLQNLFREFPEGSGMRWAPDEENAELLITSEKPRLDAVEKLPHIVVVIGSGRWGGVGMDQLQAMNVNTGARTHTDLIPSTVTYHCQAKHGLVARRLAFAASRYTNIYRRVIIRGGKLHHVGAQHNISGESPASAYTGPLSSSEIVSVQVTVPFFWQDQWRIMEPAEVLQGIRIALEAQANPLYSAGRANLNPPQMRGREVTTVPLGQDILVEE